MNEFLNTIQQGYSGYAGYLWYEITHPSFHNYFYWLILLSAVFFALEIIKPWRVQQPRFRMDFWLDFFYMFFNFFLFSLIIYNAVSMVFVNWFNDALASMGINNLVAVEVGHLPGWVQLIILLVVRDFTQWWIHRLLHRVPFLWEFHKVHHSVQQMGFAAHLRYHWMENIVYRSLEYIPLAMIGFGIEDFFIVHIFTLAVGHFNHSNFNIPLGPLKYIFNNPAMHIWHHVEDLPHDRKYGVNFGLTLSIWDYIFGTAYIPKDGRDEKLGFENVSHFPKTFAKQLIYGFGKKNPDK
jgi:sterol desaturase/sphingolipid hydroxylase (fatty acid hydroxylase superfamily)